MSFAMRVQRLARQRAQRREAKAVHGVMTARTQEEADRLLAGLTPGERSRVLMVVGVDLEVALGRRTLTAEDLVGAASLTGEAMTAEQATALVGG